MSLRDWDQAREHIAKALDDADLYGPPGAIGHFVRSLKRPKAPSTKATRARAGHRQEKAGKREAKRERTSAVYRAVARRAAGNCEACFMPFSDADPPHMDHFFGRGKYVETERSCWLIHGPSCHRQKHAGERAYWLAKFAGHCAAYGYTREGAGAQRQLEAEEISTSLPASPRSTPNHEEKPEVTT